MNKRPIAVQDSHSTTTWYGDGSKETKTQTFRKYSIVQFSISDVIPADGGKAMKAFDEMREWLKAQDLSNL